LEANQWQIAPQSKISQYPRLAGKAESRRLNIGQNGNVRNQRVDIFPAPKGRGFTPLLVNLYQDAAADNRIKFG